MKKIVIYWSGTGNTESIANLIASDTSADIKSVSEISVKEALEYDVIVLGCPAMGAEELEDMEFKPFYEELIPQVEGQKIFLFGSYDWGDGEWMRNWSSDVRNNGVELACEGLIVNGDAQAIIDSEYQAFINLINS